MGDGNFIKLYRSLLDWEWWNDKNTSRLYIYMLLKANWKEGKFQGKVIPRGSFVSSISKLAEETKLSEKQVRTAINHLKTTGELASKSTNKFTIFTINNYDYYQSKGEQNDNQKADKGQAEGKQRATIEERKKERKEESNILVSKDTNCQTDVQRVVNAWNELKHFGVKPISKLSSTSKRYKCLMARIREYGLEDVLTAIEQIKKSDFLQGKSKKGWAIRFDWFVLPNNFPKVLEGNYSNAELEQTENAMFESLPQEESSNFEQENEELVGDDW